MLLRLRLEQYFDFKQLGADWRTEILAGITTFMTMAYIIFVNPSILADAGMPLAAVTAATCISAAFGSFLMGGYAKYPIALAPGMGLNAYFAYTVVKGMGIEWQVALGAVFLSGIAFIVLTLVGVRQLIISSIPFELHSAVAAGVGLFIAFIGFRNSGIIVPDAQTTVALGNLRSPATALAVFGLILMGALLAWRVRAAMLIGILLTTAIALATGIAKWAPQSNDLAAMSATMFALDIGTALRMGFGEIIFIFLFIDIFDNVGTLVAVGKKANLFDEENRIPRVNRILISDGVATVVGAFTGTSTVVSYVESAAGVAAGGRTGVTAIVTGILFLGAMFIAPLVGAIPPAATGPALILVGCMMATVLADIRWDDMEIAVPAFLTIMTIPLTFSIATGLAFGFSAYTAMKVFRGKFREVNWLVYALTAVFLFRFLYLAKG
jgi:AGZA family xanthine/uracil permease-like MFS transporter